jgi:flagellar hook-associated protein 2
MAISSPGLASGIDIKGIVSQLVALERAPIAQLQKESSGFQSKLSVFGTITSMVSSLGDAGAKLAAANTFTAVRGSSSQADAVTVSVADGTAPTSVALEVVSLAKAQSTASGAVPVGSGMGAGSLTITLGDWSSGTFAAGSATPVTINVVEGKDTLTDIAAQINGANAGVTATVLRDASGERLLMRSKDTGQALGYQVSAADGDANDGKDLTRLAFTSLTGSGMSLTQAGTNAVAKVNGVTIGSASNTVKDALPGITLNLLKPTTGAADITVSNDKDAMRKSVQAFVDAYNTLADMLATSTKYDAATKVKGSLQGDSTAVGLQRALRGMMRSDVGVEIKPDGKLGINSTRLDAALDRPAEVARLFGATSDSPTLKGFGLKLDAFADGLVAADGTLTSRTASLRSAIDRKSREIDKVEDRAARAESRYLAQYNAMDAAVAKFSSLNAYVAQQITLWNKSSG